MQGVIYGIMHTVSTQGLLGRGPGGGCLARRHLLDYRWLIFFCESMFWCTCIKCPSSRDSSTSQWTGLHACLLMLDTWLQEPCVFRMPPNSPITPLGASHCFPILSCGHGGVGMNQHWFSFLTCSHLNYCDLTLMLSSYLLLQKVCLWSRQSLRLLNPCQPPPPTPLWSPSEDPLRYWPEISDVRWCELNPDTGFLKSQSVFSFTQEVVF